MAEVVVILAENSATLDESHVLLADETTTEDIDGLGETSMILQLIIIKFSYDSFVDKHRQPVGKAALNHHKFQVLRLSSIMVWFSELQPPLVNLMVAH